MTTTIALDELHEKMTRGDPIRLFEVLGLPYWRKHHLPGAINMPPDRVRDVASEMVPDLDTEIILYCWDDH
jgi:hypothetical protein